MPKSLQGKTALVTGSSRGIGRAIAEGLASKGAAVVVNYVGNHEAADEVVAAIAGKGGKAIAVQADISRIFIACLTRLRVSSARSTSWLPMSASPSSSL